MVAAQRTRLRLRSDAWHDLCLHCRHSHDVYSTVRRHGDLPLWQREKEGLRGSMRVLSRQSCERAGKFRLQTTVTKVGFFSCNFAFTSQSHKEKERLYMQQGGKGQGVPDESWDRRKRSLRTLSTGARSPALAPRKDDHDGCLCRTCYNAHSCSAYGNLIPRTDRRLRHYKPSDQAGQLDASESRRLPLHRSSIAGRFSSSAGSTMFANESRRSANRSVKRGEMEGSLHDSFAFRLSRSLQRW